MANDTTENYRRLLTVLANPEEKTVRRMTPEQKRVRDEKQRRAEERRIFTRTKRIVLRRDDHQCLVCGFTESVDVHHIIHVARGGDSVETNLITLCPNHHRLAHRGAITAETLRDLVRARYGEDLSGILPGHDESGRNPRKYR